MSYIAKLSLGLIGLAVSLSVSKVDAQAQNADFTECIGWETQSPRASQLARAISCLTEKIDQLERELRPFRVARGAVVAFNRDRTTEPVCPRGWDPFLPAGGRFVVGAGEHDNTLTEYPSYVEDETQAVGGVERFLIESSTIPPHKHNSFDIDLQSESNLVGGQGDTFESIRHFGRRDKISSLKTGHEVLNTNGNAVGQQLMHDNMPPYVALYYCIRD